jgi:urea transport system permease protein
MGAMFIGVVLAFPEGLAGLYKVYVEPHILKIVRSMKTQTSNISSGK